MAKTQHIFMPSRLQSITFFIFFSLFSNISITAFSFSFFFFCNFIFLFLHHLRCSYVISCTNIKLSSPLALCYCYFTLCILLLSQGFKFINFLIFSFRLIIEFDIFLYVVSKIYICIFYYNLCMFFFIIIFLLLIC